MTVHSSFKQLIVQLENLYDLREATNIADWVLEHITQKSRTWRIINKDVELTVLESGLLKSITEKLLLNIPIQYVLNESWFAGMKFFVNKSVLIPRPETEELVDWLVADLNNSTKTNSPLKILDIGTGSGCIPISLKKKLSNCQITSIDISEEAIEVAQRNAHSLKADINFRHINFLEEDNWNSLGKFDLIISNPPYIRQFEGLEMSSRVTNYEPSVALFVPDEEPLLFYTKISLFAKQYLNEDGSIYVEINELLSVETLQMFSRNGFSTELKQDLQGRDRMIKAKLFSK